MQRFRPENIPSPWKLSSPLKIYSGYGPAFPLSVDALFQLN